MSTTTTSELSIGTGTTRILPNTQTSAATEITGFHGGLSTGAYIAIPCVAVVILVVIGVSGYWAYRQKRKRKQARRRADLEIQALEDLKDPEVSRHKSLVNEQTDQRWRWGEFQTRELVGQPPLILKRDSFVNGGVQGIDPRALAEARRREELLVQGGGGDVVRGA